MNPRGSRSFLRSMKRLRAFRDRFDQPVMVFRNRYSARKKAPSEWTGLSFGRNSGEGGIRTHGTGSPYARFRGVCLQPLGHLSGRSDNQAQNVLAGPARCKHPPCLPEARAKIESAPSSVIATCQGRTRWESGHDRAGASHCRAPREVAGTDGVWKRVSRLSPRPMNVISPMEHTAQA